MLSGGRICASNDTGLNQSVECEKQQKYDNYLSNYILFSSFSFSYFVCAVQISGKLFLCQSLTEINHSHQSPVRD